MFSKALDDMKLVCWVEGADQPAQITHTGLV
jgi:hypothetical protein